MSEGLGDPFGPRYLNAREDLTVALKRRGNAMPMQRVRELFDGTFDDDQFKELIERLVEDNIVNVTGDRVALTLQGTDVAIPVLRSRKARERGEVAPPQGRTMISIPVNRAFYDHMTRYAASVRLPLTYVVREAMVDYMAAKGTPIPQDALFVPGHGRRRAGDE